MSATGWFLPLALAATALCAHAQKAVRTDDLGAAPFRVLDNVEGDDVDLLAYPVKPMVVARNHQTLYAVNTHGSEVVAFGLSGSRKTYPVPWNPVSIEYWVSPVDSHHELLVVSRGTYGLTRLAPASGALLGYLELPAEPGGTFLLGNHLFVACSALDQVVEIDLLTNTVFQTFEIETTRHLLFLSGDGLGRVLVTPLVSGNNTMPRRSAVAGEFATDPNGNVLDMTNPVMADQALPDEDVFRIVPGATPGSGRVEVAAKGVGTMLYAHGRNPATAKLWVLNTRSNNADVVLDSESEIRGLFSENRLSLVTLPPLGGAPATNHTFVSLDDVPPDPLGKPFALAFASTGEAMIVGALTDNVSVLSPTGAHLLSWDLPAGSIPRGALLDEVTGRVYTYCWGTNTIEVRGMQVPPPVLMTLDLGNDPTSPERKAGRAAFYDGHNSLRKNASCETCHVEGQMDHLTWNLSQMPTDDKGVFATPNLKGIEFTGPYGWRGELAIGDFNRKFHGVLGGEELSSEQYAQFQAFLFGIQNPANPYEHPRRVISEDKEARRFDFPTHANLSAVNGQEIYFRDATVFNDTCQECHALPTGTNNDFFPAAKGDTGHRNTLKNTAFNGMWRKEPKTLVTVKERFRPAELRPPLGSGASRAGLANGLWDFCMRSYNAEMTTEARHDVIFFQHQIDQGLAPAVHRAFLIAPSRPDPLGLIDYFEDQARQRNCSLVAFGKVDLGSGPQNLRWYWDRATELFVPEDADLAPQPLQFFVQQAKAGTGTNLLVGLPVGMARRFAVDIDNDLLFTQDEAQRGTDPRDGDSDDDGFLDGTEVRLGSNPLSAASLPTSAQAPAITRVKKMYHTARVAKILVEADRPVKLDVVYSSNLGDSGTFVEDREYKTMWEVALRDLEPSNETAGIHSIYSGMITVRDEFGNQAHASLPLFETMPFINAEEFDVPRPLEIESVLRDLELVTARPAGAGLGWNFTFQGRVENRKFSAPAPLANHVIVARVLRNGLVETNIDMNGGPPASDILSDLNFSGQYGGTGGFGPFVVGTISGASGVSTITFRLPAALRGDDVQLSVEMVGRPVDVGTFVPTAPHFDDSSLYDYANTPREYRATPVFLLPYKGYLSHVKSIPP